MGSVANETKIPYGKRLIANVIDDIARTEPQRECLQIPKSSDPKDGWRVVTFKDYSNAVNRCAHRIVETCGKAPAGAFPTIAYIGPNDARYVVLMVACIKAGYKALFISPRNSQEGQVNLFDKTDCHFIAYAKSYGATIQPWLQERPDLRAVEVSSMESWFPCEEYPHFPYDKTFEQGEWEPLVVLHTSGSTGLPKPIVVAQGMLAISDAWHNLPEWNGSHILIKVWADNAKRHFIPMPLYHAGALYCFIMNAIYWDRPVCLSDGDRPLSSDLVVECLNNLDVESAMLPPSILEDMSQSSECTKALAKLKCVVFGGGNLVRESGNRLVQNGVKLCNFIGATEFAPFPIYFQTNPELWQYFVFHSELFGADWRRQDGEDNVYRLVVVRKGKEPGSQGFFYTFPDENEYDTKDLYKPHPKLPNHWMYYGRSDNIIVFSNGEKLNPVTIEEIVGDHPALQGALVVGYLRFQPALFIEPIVQPKNAEEEKNLIDDVWPLVVHANKESVAHGQISRELIAVSKPDMPFLRAGKGTIQRAATVKLYKDEIDRLYEKNGEVSHTDAPRLDVSSEDALIQSIESLFQTHMGAPKLEADQDFFSAGIDSMQVISASRLLRAGLAGAGHQVEANALATRVIYGNPTPRRLAQYIMHSVIREGGKNAHNEDVEQQQAMKYLHEKYVNSLVGGKPGRPEALSEGQTVLITGTTGMLGSYMLDLMARDPKVKKVICLNRAEDGGVRQQVKAMKDRGLDTSYGGKAEFYRCDVSRWDFGLSRDVYHRLLREADRVIHNAWPVNFNITVETFEPHLRGVRNFADFAAKAEKRVAVVFISSIGTGDRWDATKGPLPEERMEDVSLPGGGYGRSKMVGSLILEDAAKVGDFPAAIIRVGQIAGPEAEAGQWNRQEWFPSIVASSLHLGALPDNLGSFNRVDWTPAERIAKLVLEVGGVSQKVAPADISGYYHGVNSSVTSWEKLAPAVQEFFGQDRIKELVSFKEWVDRLEKSQNDNMESVDSNPGIKLIDSYRAMAEHGSENPVVFDMAKTVLRSVTMKNSTAITPDDMRRWCKQWAY